jgi:hypothetical protein
LLRRVCKTTILLIGVVVVWRAWVVLAPAR